MGKTILALDFLLNQSTGRNFIHVQLENDVARTNELVKLKEFVTTRFEPVTICDKRLQRVAICDKRLEFL
jgi:hypothetical protein